MAADLRRMSAIYHWPTESTIEQLIDEVTEMLALDYMKTLELGFERDGQRVLSLKYESRRDGTLTINDNAGGIPRGVDVSGCEKFNYMTYTEKFNTLSADEKLAVKKTLPYVRNSAEEPTDGSGYWVQDRTYSSGGGGTVRKTFKPL
jgi:hypothetical protein